MYYLDLGQDAQRVSDVLIFFGYGRGQVSQHPCGYKNCALMRLFSIVAGGKSSA
jgi:hypothetical protein